MFQFFKKPESISVTTSPTRSKYRLVIIFNNESIETYKWEGVSSKYLKPIYKILTTTGLSYIDKDNTRWHIPWHQIKKASYTEDIIKGGVEVEA